MPARLLQRQAHFGLLAISMQTVGLRQALRRLLGFLGLFGQSFT
jgi:hypothetical protein